MFLNFGLTGSTTKQTFLSFLERGLSKSFIIRTHMLYFLRHKLRSGKGAVERRDRVIVVRTRHFIQILPQLTDLVNGSGALNIVSSILERRKLVRSVVSDLRVRPHNIHGVHRRGQSLPLQFSLHQV